METRKVLGILVLLVGFEIPVHDAVVVEILQGQNGLGEVHPGHVDGQRFDVLQQRGAVSPWRTQPESVSTSGPGRRNIRTAGCVSLTLHVLHHHAQVPPGLEGAEHGDDKRVLCERQDVPLHKGLLDLVPQDQVLLVDLLHGEALPGLPVAHQIHRPEPDRTPVSI